MEPERLHSLSDLHWYFAQSMTDALFEAVMDFGLRQTLLNGIYALRYAELSIEDRVVLEDFVVRHGH